MYIKRFPPDGMTPPPFTVSVTLPVVCVLLTQKKIVYEKNWNIKSSLEFQPPPPRILSRRIWTGGLVFLFFCSTSCLKYCRIDISSSPTTSCAFLCLCRLLLFCPWKRRENENAKSPDFSLFVVHCLFLFSPSFSPPPTPLELLYSFLSLNFFFSVIVLYIINFQSLRCKYRMSPIFTTWKLIKHFHNNEKYWNNN